jgi:hypothetical protein
MGTALVVAAQERHEQMYVFEIDAVRSGCRPARDRATAALFSSHALTVDQHYALAIAAKGILNVSMR